MCVRVHTFLPPLELGLFCLEHLFEKWVWMCCDSHCCDLWAIQVKEAENQDLNLGTVTLAHLVDLILLVLPLK